MKGLLLALFGFALIAPGAYAQTGRHVAIGVGAGFHKYVEDDFSQKSPGFSLLYRINFKLGHKDGWTIEPKGSVDWFKTDVQTTSGSVDTHLGKIRSIPVLAGAGPSYRHGRTKLGMGVMVGPSFNKFTTDNLRIPRVGISAITVKNSVFVRPEASLWYDVSNRLGIHAGLGYVYNRPKAEITSGSVTTEEKWKTDHLNFSVGFAVGII